MNCECEEKRFLNIRFHSRSSKLLLEQEKKTNNYNGNNIYIRFDYVKELSVYKVVWVDLNFFNEKNIEKYIQQEYGVQNTTFIAYGAETEPSKCSEEKYEKWLQEKGLRRGEYYLIVGRFVPENNYETMIKEYMKSKTKKDFAIITNANPQLQKELEEKLGYQKDPRIKFVGTVYDQELY